MTSKRYWSPSRMDTRLTVWASRNVCWGDYDKGFFKREFVDWDKHPRWCYSFWIGSWGITFHWYTKS